MSAAPFGDQPPSGPVDLVVEAEGWFDALPDLETVADTAARLALENAGIAPDRAEIALLACDDDRIAQLNTAFRGRAVPTNVLSWPAFNLAPDSPGETPAAPPLDPEMGPICLGDVAIALQTVRREAESASIPLKDHVTHLILHGCLHLLGYDHQTDADAEVMEGIETRQLRAVGIADPYGEGGAAGPPDDDGR